MPSGFNWNENRSSEYELYESNVADKNIIIDGIETSLLEIQSSATRVDALKTLIAKCGGEFPLER